MSAEGCLVVSSVIVGAEDFAVFWWPFEVFLDPHPLQFLNFVFCCFLRKFLRRLGTTYFESGVGVGEIYLGWGVGWLKLVLHLMRMESWRYC